MGRRCFPSRESNPNWRKISNQPQNEPNLCLPVNNEFDFGSVPSTLPPSHLFNYLRTLLPRPFTLKINRTEIKSYFWLSQSLQEFFARAFWWSWSRSQQPFAGTEAKFEFTGQRSQVRGGLILMLVRVSSFHSFYSDSWDFLRLSWVSSSLSLVRLWFLCHSCQVNAM